MKSLKFLACLLGSAVALSLSGCSSAPEKPKASPLPVVSGSFKVQNVWKNQIGPVQPHLLASLHGQQMVVASAQGQLALMDVQNGRDVWRISLNAPIQAGVGGDGRRFAVVTQANELVVVEAGKVLWRHVLPALSYTPPLVAGERVFVMTGDRAVSAFDAQTGQRLWSQQRSSDPLLLRQAGLLIPFGDNLLVGWGGRLASLNPLTGAVRWETMVGVTRGTNEVERLVDLVAGVSRQGGSLCLRAFQISVACLDGLTGRVMWSRPAQGHQGLDGNENVVIGTESDSKVLAWDRNSGAPLWAQESLRFRGLSMPSFWSNFGVVGDQDGWVHFLAPQDGKPVQRVATDGSGIMGKPIVAGQTLVVVTRNGNIFGLRAE
jgi:outer membrane assembly lipoprotein YfgL